MRKLRQVNPKLLKRIDTMLTKCTRHIPKYYNTNECQQQKAIRMLNKHFTHRPVLFKHDKLRTYGYIAKIDLCLGYKINEIEIYYYDFMTLKINKFSCFVTDDFYYKDINKKEYTAIETLNKQMNGYYLKEDNRTIFYDETGRYQD